MTDDELFHALARATLVTLVDEGHQREIGRAHV